MFRMVVPFRKGIALLYSVATAWMETLPAGNHHPHLFLALMPIHTYSVVHKLHPHLHTA